MKTFSRTEAIALARVDQDRLQRLAEMARRSPRVMLKFVLRHGFDEVERDIRETLAAERDAALHGSVAHAEVMRSARRIVEASRTRKLPQAP